MQELVELVEGGRLPEAVGRYGDLEQLLAQHQPSLMGTDVYVDLQVCSSAIVLPYIAYSIRVAQVPSNEGQGGRTAERGVLTLRCCERFRNYHPPVSARYVRTYGLELVLTPP